MSDDRNLPWTYRPRHFDDWGWIRDASGDLAACARGDKEGKTHDEHRADKTDPYGDYAAFIVKAVNAHDALLAEIAKLREQLVRANALIQFLEDEATRYAEMYRPNSDGRNTFVIFRDIISGEIQRLAKTDEKST